MGTPQVVLYRYEASPFSHKVDNALLLKGIPHRRVQVSPLLPRPEISEELGINYRRIPLLAIGNDVYCDTSLIVSVLERRFPPSQGYGTLFPAAKHGESTDTGLIRLFSKFYADNALFSPAALLVPWEKLPASFVNDRSDLLGAPMNPVALVANRDNALSRLSSHLTMIEEQLGDGREWLFDTAAPGLADISVYFILTWTKNSPTCHVLWLARLSALLQAKNQERHAPKNIEGSEAGDYIFASKCEPDSVVGFDAQEGNRLHVSLGDRIRVSPDDTGRNHPTTGKLVALSLSEVVLEIHTKKGSLKCHFPRLGYVIKGVDKPKL